MCKLIVEMKLKGKKTSEIENVLGISESNIRSIWKKYLISRRSTKQKEAEVLPRSQCGILSGSFFKQK